MLKLNLKAVEFELNVQLAELFNVPQLDHLSCFYIQTISNSRLTGKHQYHHRHAIRSAERPVENHKSVFNNERILTRVKLYANPKEHYTLSDKWLYITFFVHDSLNSKKDKLGTLELNLTEYVNDREPKNLRYLLKDSKTNAILRLSVYMKHLNSAQDYRYHVPKKSTQQIYADLKDSIENSKKEFPEPETHKNDSETILNDIINKTFKFNWQFNGVNYDELSPIECVKDITQRNGNGWKRNELPG
ncbi:hypothetical protein KL930_003437 [Ogataea haglerorum]|uniref:C2 NT-type domain-containing protein n=1 Tax=Ogataea haglerorum TaxID=1937702 RepID=A0AAN6I0L7_9ASCO|nr:uncharacterized protein KL911_003029 [Ogataea haglerorum]KAG7695440.1 hypothetical protein KL915_002830 [Ogataea haglerorum]KAG7695769.1 hypothetical protein KL951_003294 [Ogataea haglerorum]KAG7705807.1 hypothetical protein KL914_003645 [Ogataea haglerorum]KAG7707175.1 hypothetical protein KL950_002835 [Ogataea haglerorum]KAG7718531.1 hypothetical protein KL913_002526 [Ogataea haglerorum]